MPDNPSWVKSCEMLNTATSLWIQQIKVQDHNLVFLILSAPHSQSNAVFGSRYQPTASQYQRWEGFMHLWTNNAVRGISVYILQNPTSVPVYGSCRISLISSAINQTQSICTMLRKSKMQDTYRNWAAWPFSGANSSIHPSIHPRAEPVLSWIMWGLSISSTKAVSVSRTETWCDSWV